MGKRKHGYCGTRIYRIWRGMISRCEIPTASGYKWYGGRGISVCKEWRVNFERFLEWAIDNGYTDALTLDRIDNNGNYEPSNCRWATPKQQANNTRRSHKFKVNNKEKTASQWSEETGVSAFNIYNRVVNLGWNEKEATTKAANHVGRDIKYEAFGKVQTLKDWAKEYQINYYTLWSRINERHMAIEEALTTPIGQARPRLTSRTRE